MKNQPALNALQTAKQNTQFNAVNQPSPISKKLGWEKRRMSITIQSALMAELSKEVFDANTGVVITGAENFAIELLNEWKTTKDPRYAKLIMDFVQINTENIETRIEPIKVIIQTTGNRPKNN